MLLYMETGKPILATREATNGLAYTGYKLGNIITVDINDFKSKLIELILKQLSTKA